MRRAIGSMTALGLCLAMTACGGGSGINSASTSPTPVPTPTPTPTPTNTGIGNLQYNQVFATNAASVSTTIDATAKQVVGASPTAPSTVQVSYDAASRSYTITAPARTQTFAPADVQPQTNPGETRYAKTTGTTRDYLTLAVTPYSSSVANQYVGLGFWQRNTGTGNTQNTTFDSFVYGFDTPAGAVPHTGSAGYNTDSLGFVTTPGKAPRAFTGGGTFNVDLALGIFAAHSYVTEYELTSSAAVSGGGIEFTGGGHLASGNGFSGNFTYGGMNTLVSGTIAGRFYGPGAEELGASFSADDGAGGSVTGSLTGQRNSNVAPANLSLVNLVTDQLYYSNEALLGTQTNGGSNIYNGIGQLQQHTDGSFSLGTASSEYAGSTFTAADRVSDTRPNFTTYEKTVNGRTLRVSFYKPGPANTELALTYAGFGSSFGGASSGYTQFDGRYYFIYGIATPDSLLSRRTGTGSYAGVAYGVGVGGGTVYDVHGTSRFDVDFGAQTYAGTLALNGTPTAGGGTTDFGSWSFADRLVRGQGVQTGLSHNGVAYDPANIITPRFYGPDGEEIAATFSLRTGAQSAPGTVSIVGATVARRQ